MKRLILLLVAAVLVGCSQEAADRQTAVDDLAEKVIAEKTEQKKQAEQEKPKPQVESVGQTKAERVIEAYLLSDTAKGRARFVLEPKTALPRMEKYYRDRNLRGLKVDAVLRVDGEGDPKVGRYGEYRADVVNRRGSADVQYCYVKNTHDGMKIDWEATIGYNEMSWPAFKASRPKKAVIMRAELKLSPLYPLEFVNAQHAYYCVMMSFAEYGVVRKNSSAGRRIFNILKDGENHNITVKVRYSQSGESVIIDDLVSENWLIR